MPGIVRRSTARRHDVVPENRPPAQRRPKYARVDSRAEAAAKCREDVPSKADGARHQHQQAREAFEGAGDRAENGSGDQAGGAIESERDEALVNRQVRAPARPRAAANRAPVSGARAGVQIRSRRVLGGVIRDPLALRRHHAPEGTVRAAKQPGRRLVVAMAPARERSTSMTCSSPS